MERQFTKGECSLPHFARNETTACDCGFLFVGEETTIGCLYFNKHKGEMGEDNHPEIEQAISNADLITDAFNTANKTGLFASEILAQRDELLKHLIDSNKILESILFFYGKEMTIVDKFGVTAQVNQNNEAIKNATK